MADPDEPRSAEGSAEDGSALPTVLEGVLDATQCARLFHDLETCSTIERVQVRGAESPADRVVTLDEARVLLEAGEARAVQIRYRYQEAAWCDTLLVKDGGVRLVRMRQDAAPS